MPLTQEEAIRWWDYNHDGILNEIDIAFKEGRVDTRT